MQYQLNGINNFFNFLYSALNDDKSSFDEIFTSIQKIYLNIFNNIKKKNLKIDQFTEKNQITLKFLEFINDKNNFTILFNRTREIRNYLSNKLNHKNIKIFLKFFPSRTNWKLKYSKEKIHIELNIPFLLADINICKGIIDKIIVRDKKITNDDVSNFMISDKYKEISQNFLTTKSTKINDFENIYNLDELFDKLNQKYFNNTIIKPILKWSKNITYTKFGEYNPIKNQITLSKTLSHKNIPQFVTEYVLYHEMLHIKYPMKVSENGLKIHHKEFQMMEKQFENYEMAEKYLKHLSIMLRKKLIK